MNPTIVCGDLHGDYKIAETIIENCSDGYDIVFVGDYLDSFHYSIEDQVKCLEVVLSASEQLNNVKALMGNHEMSYLESGCRCSGWNFATDSHVIHMQHRMRKELLDYIWLGGKDEYLISHAGVSKTVLDALGTDLDTYLLEGRGVGLFDQAGRARGGYAQCGGLRWCDWWQEFEPVDKVRQIVGHSQYRPKGHYGVATQGVVTKGDNWNIDCLQGVKEVVIVSDSGVDIVDYYDVKYKQI